MHIVFIKNYDIYKAGKEYTLERTLAARMCELGVAITFTEHLDRQAEAARKKADADAKAKSLKAGKAKEKKTAVSRKATRRSKAVK